jgi:hypothetical protein
MWCPTYKCGCSWSNVNDQKTCSSGDRKRQWRRANLRILRNSNLYKLEVDVIIDIIYILLIQSMLYVLKFKS